MCNDLEKFARGVLYGNNDQFHLASDPQQKPQEKKAEHADNDNTKEWPLIPFPEGWDATS